MLNITSSGVEVSYELIIAFIAGFGICVVLIWIIRDLIAQVFMTPTVFPIASTAQSPEQRGGCGGIGLLLLLLIIVAIVFLSGAGS